jgi:hypothetical protein
MEDCLYEMCGHETCSHFIEDNAGYEDGTEIARFVHLDDGKEYDHDAVPSGERRCLNEWRALRPELFVMYDDGKIGPNSACFPSAAGGEDGDTAKAVTTVYVLRYSHKHGDELSAHVSLEAAIDDIAGIARECWHEIADDPRAPETPDNLSDEDAVSVYFERNTEENYEIEALPVQGATAVILTPDQADTLYGLADDTLKAPDMRGWSTHETRLRAALAALHAAGAGYRLRSS